MVKSAGAMIESLLDSREEGGAAGEEGTSYQQSMQSLLISLSVTLYMSLITG